MDTELRNLIHAAMANQDRPSGKRGVWCLADLKLRCRVEAGGCWVWSGCVYGGQGRTVVLPWGGNPTTLGTAVCMLVTSKRPKPGIYWHPHQCGNALCCNPWHRQPMTKSEIFAGRAPSMSSQLKMTVTRRAQGKISDADYAAIMASEEPTAVLASRYGIHPRHVRALKTLRRRRPAPLFVVGLMP